MQQVGSIQVKRDYVDKVKLFRLRNHQDSFTVSLYEGRVKTKSGKVFDREEKEEYFIQIEMRVIGEAAIALVLLEVTVEDLNDNAPQFVKLPYRFGVKVGSPPSTFIGQVSLTLVQITNDNIKNII